MKLYVASSWRNPKYPSIIKLLREAGYDCYDFKNPAAGNNGFHWREIDPAWTASGGQRTMTLAQYRDKALTSVQAETGFKFDFDAMKWADACVLVLPCGRSAHLEAGWFVGQGRPCHILLDEDKFEPELMYKMATSISIDTNELLLALEDLDEVRSQL